ncbi:sensor histidine kinase, partial [Bacteroidota bacterium]
PALLLVLISIYVLGRIKTLLSAKIKKDWLQFGILAIVLLFFADIIIILSVSAFDFLTIPDDYTIVPFIRKDTVITTIILSSISIPILFLFRFIESKIQEKANSILVKTFLIFVSTGFLPFIFLCTIFIVGLKEGQNKQGGYTTLANIFVGLMILATIRALISYFIFKERSLIVENENKLSHLRELKTKAELKSLQSQINPHFLYNSLNSIASLAPIDAQKTQKMAHSLSDLFKYSINRKGKKMSTIQDEIEMVNSYLEIEKIRFGERLQFVIEVEAALKENEIPLFLIQPLVENAVKHGISKNKGIGKIVLKIEEDKNELFIRVLDNGPDFPEGLISGHGLQTVYDLLRLSYGDKAGLYWTNKPEKMIIIRIANNEKDE